MRPSFYEYINRFYDPNANDPTSRLANAIHEDHSFPKHSDNFEEISSYLESSTAYTKLLTVFDDEWHKYQFEL